MRHGRVHADDQIEVRNQRGSVGEVREVRGQVDEAEFPQRFRRVSGGVGFTAIAIALVGGTRPSGVVVTALVFGALRNGGGLMGLETSIPIDLLFFIQALVIMFIAAPNLTARIIRMPFRRQTKGAPS